jgi:hypothetical protein
MTPYALGIRPCATTQTKEASEMPKISRDSAPQRQEAGPVVDEVFVAGDAFSTPPGHIPVANEPGTEFVSFSPSEEIRTAEAVMMKNMHAMRDGSTQ